MSIAMKAKNNGSWRAFSRNHLLGSAALLALSVPAGAQVIDTTPQWNGVSFISSWGAPNTSTYGQTFTPVAGQTRLSGFTMELLQGGGTAPQYQAFVYEFANNRITGNALFSSGVLTAPSSTTAYTPVSVNTGNVTLAAGHQYVVFLTLSTQSAQAPSNYRYGALTNNAAIPNGQFVFMNNGTVFSDLSANPWSNIGEDLAFKAFLSAQNVGENNAQAQQGAFQLGNSYLSLLTDPFSTNRVGTTGTMGYATDKKVPPAVAAANAMVTKAPPIVYSPRWDVWGAAFGGTNNTRGDTAAGTSDSYARVAGVAAGADYRYAPDSLIGFSLGGGNINWSLSGPTGLGGGASDAFMAGIYGKHMYGPGYVSGAVTYTNYWMRTDRGVAPGLTNQLHADFNAESWGGRLEAGYHVGNFMMIRWTPYGAIQGQSFHTPGFNEVAVVGAPIEALNVAGRTATAFRGEVGLRSDKIVAVDNGGQFNLFGKLAFAHDEVSNPSLSVNFSDPGSAPFTIFGARPSRDLALTTAGAEWRLANGISFLVKFDGEFGERSQTYNGTGRIRYTW